MHPSELHYIESSSSRADSLRGFSVDTGNYISDTYDHLSDQETKRFLRALRHGVEIAGIEAGLRSSEIVTSLSPKDALPFSSKIWRKRSTENGAITLDPAPYRVVRVEDGIDQSNQIPHSYNNDTGVLTLDGGNYSGEFWIVESRYKNKEAEQYIVDKYDAFEKWQFGPSYPPPHFLHFTRLFEEARQKGGRSYIAYRLASAALGVPFAYAPGTIREYNSQNGLRIAKIEDGDKITGSFIPLSTSAENLKPVGTSVGAFEPLIQENGNEGLKHNGKARQWSTPVLINSTEPRKEKITLDENVSLDLFDRVRLRLLSGDFQEIYLVRHSNGNDVYVEGEIPPVSSSEWAYLQMLNESASPQSDLQLDVPTPYPVSDKEMVMSVLKAARYPGAKTSLNINKL
jgi:hypothetical protein